MDERESYQTGAETFKEEGGKTGRGRQCCRWRVVFVLPAAASVSQQNILLSWQEWRIEQEFVEVALGHGFGWVHHWLGF